MKRNLFFTDLANQFGGDLAATDSTRVLRLPGFANRKLPEEFIVQARQESDAVYTLRDFTIHEDSPETPRHIGDVHRTKPDGARPTTKANPNTIGPTRSAPSPAETIPKS